MNNSTYFNGKEWNLNSLINCISEITCYRNFRNEIIYFFSEKKLIHDKSTTEYYAVVGYNYRANMKRYFAECDFCLVKDMCFYIKLYNGYQEKPICDNCVDILEKQKMNHEIYPCMFKFHNVRKGNIRYDAIFNVTDDRGNVTSCIIYKR